MRKIAIRRLKEAMALLINEDPQKTRAAVADVLSGKLPVELQKEKTLPKATRKRTHDGVSAYIPKGVTPNKVRKLNKTLETLISD